MYRTFGVVHLTILALTLCRISKVNCHRFKAASCERL